MSRVPSRRRHKSEEWTEALVDINRCIADMENIDNILALILDLARRLLDADTGALGLWNTTGDQLDLKCYTTADGPTATPGMVVQSQWIVDAIRARTPCRYPEDLQVRWTCPITGHEIEAAAITPLQLDGKGLGGLWVARYTAQPFTRDDLVRLQGLADQAVIALEHALMASRLQSLAVTEERTRIAREMHDGLAQILGFLNLQMQTLESLVRQGEQEKVLAELKQARQRIKAAHADVRENILSLRTTLSGKIGLIAALQQYVDEFGLQTGLDVQLFVGIRDTPCLSPLAETQLVRIIQEALTNVRKHAQANFVRVHLAERDHGLLVTIADDGIGMTPGTISRSHFGLQTMRERAESVGGDITIQSWPARGTEVQLWLPFVQN